jgi:uncharacterized protein YndB with AHSA1/START domain
MTTSAALPHQLNREVVIRASRETVFRFFTDSTRWAAWWGAGSTIDARPGGTVVIRYPNALEALGEVIDLDPPGQITFTYGYKSGTPIPAGGSRVSIRLEAIDAGTRLRLTHDFHDASVRDEHVQGWRYQLSLFANLVSDEVCATAGSAVDAWFGAWSDPDSSARETTLARIATPGVLFCDRFSALEGRQDVTAHLDASHRFMPGLQLRRSGDTRHCQGVVLADWIAQGQDEQERARGTNVFVFNEAGQIESVTGFWNQHPAERKT